jgi:hypothetical protein
MNGGESCHRITDSGRETPRQCNVSSMRRRRRRRSRGGEGQTKHTAITDYLTKEMQHASERQWAWAVRRAGEGKEKEREDSELHEIYAVMARGSELL